MTKRNAETDIIDINKKSRSTCLSSSELFSSLAIKPHRSNSLSVDLYADVHSLIIEFALRGRPKSEYSRGQHLLNLQMDESNVLDCFDVDYCTFVRLYAIPNHKWRETLLRTTKKFSPKENLVFFSCVNIDQKEERPLFTTSEINFMELLTMRYNISQEIWSSDEDDFHTDMVWRRALWDGVYNRCKMYTKTDLAYAEHDNFDNLTRSGATVTMVIHCLTYLSASWEYLIEALLQAVQCGRSDIIRAMQCHPTASSIAALTHKISWEFGDYQQVDISNADKSCSISLSHHTFQDERSTDAFLVMTSFSK